MGFFLRTNVMALNAYRQYSMNSAAMSKIISRLASGYRINHAADDPSGLAISEKMKAQIAGLQQASANAQDGISLAQTTEGALAEVHNMLNRMVELATKSANGTIQNAVDREAIQTEVSALKDEITRIAKSTDFNGIKLLDGSLQDTAGQSGLTLFVGTANEDFNKITVHIDDLSAQGLGLGDLDISTQEGAAAAISRINDAINQVSTNRSGLGALQNRLEYTINSLDTAAENLSAANSRIRDTDMAKEVMEYAKMNILLQVAQAMLAQANQQPRSILQLLG